jgi:adenine-specific DNA glycosylase
LRAPQRWKELQETASACLDPKSPGDWNQGMMELGATLCTPKSPQCLLCPVNEFCEGRKLGIAECLPEKRKKRATVAVMLAAAVFADKKGQTLLLPPPASAKTSDAKRIHAEEKTSADHVPTLVSKMWHFPTLSVNGSPAAQLRAHLHKLFPNLKNAEQRLTPAEKVRHAVTYRDVTVLPFRIEVNKLPSVSGAKRIPLADLSSLPVSNLTRKVARAALAAATQPFRKRTV